MFPQRELSHIDPNEVSRDPKKVGNNKYKIINWLMLLYHFLLSLHVSFSILNVFFRFFFFIGGKNEKWPAVPHGVQSRVEKFTS